MSILKNTRLWSGIALVASIVCVVAMFNVLAAFRSGAEGMTFRAAGESLRTLVQIGAGILVFSLVTLIFARKNKVALSISLLATLLIGVPVIGAIALNPDQISAPAGPPQAAGGMGGPAGAGGMGPGAGGMAPDAGGMAPAGAGRTPPLNDISTDTQNPPQYNAVAPLRPEGSNTLEYPANGPQLQKQLFPDIAPIQSDLDMSAAYDRALEVAEGMGWDIVADNKATGMIEAISSTFFFGFKDDVVIRVQADGAGSVVDIRSHSRQGRGDRGKNAERVRAFIEKF